VFTKLIALFNTQMSCNFDFIIVAYLFDVTHLGIMNAGAGSPGMCLVACGSDHNKVMIIYRENKK